MKTLQVGDTIPAFETTDHLGQSITQNDFHGKRVVLFFYPKANTPGCTAEACDLRDHYAELQAAGYSLYGVSADSEKKQKNFADKYDFPFPLLADESKAVIEGFGVWGSKGKKWWQNDLKFVFLGDQFDLPMSVQFSDEKSFENLPSIEAKALRINLNQDIYGTFAEIGAGQEVARHFFRVGGASGTIAKTISAYDKNFSDTIYGEEDDKRYVTEARLDKMLAHEIRLDGVLITHDHADHTAGLDDIRPYCFRQGPLDFYATAEVFKALENRFGYIFQKQNKYPGAPSIQINPIEKNSPFVLQGKTITPIEAIHYKMPVLGFRLDKFAYLTDVKTLAEDQIPFLENLDVLVLNALREEEHPSHLNLEEALALVDRLQPKQTYFTHFSHLLGFHDEVSQKLPPHVALAYDTLSITIPFSNAD